MKIIILFMLFFSGLYAEINTRIISDTEFTNYNAHPLVKYISVFSDKMSIKDIKYIVYWYRRCGINPLVGIVTRLKEGMPRDYYAFGYGIHLDEYRDSARYKAFETQVRYSAHCFMKHYKIGLTNKRVYIYSSVENGGFVEVGNATTYALYRYTPLWRVEYEKDTHGNFVFVRIWEKYKKRMDAKNKK